MSRLRLGKIKFNKRFIQLTLLTLTLVIIVASVAFASFRVDIIERFKAKQYLPPVELYTRPLRFIRGNAYTLKDAEATFKALYYRQRDFFQPLQNRDFAIGNQQQCLSLFYGSKETSGLENVQSCIKFRAKGSEQNEIESLAIFSDRIIIATYQGSPFTRVDKIEVEPMLFAQYIENQPVLKKQASLGETPTYCLNALIAIEDSQFLEHQGVSVKGLFRALFTNLREGRVAQGGSTLTQQLIKNSFLTPERTIARKLKELAMALTIETSLTKDEILEAYINTIYMGQNGPFQVRGFGAAADHYFKKPLNELNLQECALMAALVNSPGLYNPFQHVERATKRRQKVLEDMKNLKLISAEEFIAAEKTPLPGKASSILTEPAPYFVQAVLKQLEELSIHVDEGVKVFTSLDPISQENAQTAVAEGIQSLEKRFPKLVEEAKKKHPLQGLFISVDPQTGEVVALVGGRDFKNTQYNRAFESMRQVGSTMKPFVYLAALQNNMSLSPLSVLQDEPLNYKEHGKTWRPKNYDGKFRGSVPMFYGLQESLNIPTIRLGLDAGMDKVVAIVKKYGATSKIEAFPSLALGAFELTPLEVAQIYSTLSQFGVYHKVHLISSVQDLSGNKIYEPVLEEQNTETVEAAAQTIGMLKMAARFGTGRSATAYGVTVPFGSKTGTTNDTKDAWFVGFTPDQVALAWVGFDDNAPTKLTGASGALPLWASYMRREQSRLSQKDFNWPSSLKTFTPTPETWTEWKIENPATETLPFELIVRGEQP